MRISDALKEMHDEHKMLTNDPLIIEFSHGMALYYFMRKIEVDLGMSAGELRLVRFREGWDSEMFDGIEFRVSGGVSGEAVPDCDSVLPGLA